MAVLYGKDSVVLSSNELVGIEQSISALIFNANQDSRVQKPRTLVDKLPLNAVRVAETRTFNSEQEKAFYTLTSTDRISLLNGSAGTGKSYVLSAVSEAYKESDYQVHGIALQAITAKAIATDCDIPSSTIASFLANMKAVI
jgi:Cdc6-like AAA superfamily ATPase